MTLFCRYEAVLPLASPEFPAPPPAQLTVLPGPVAAWDQDLGLNASLVYSLASQQVQYSLASQQVQYSAVQCNTVQYSIVQYSLASQQQGADLFSISPATGAVSLARNITDQDLSQPLTLIVQVIFCR